MEPTAADKAALDHLKPVEPDFVVQTGDFQPGWFEATAEQLRTEGATYFTYFRHPDHLNLGLVHGWKVPPANEGEPRWALTTA